ncbi:MAG: hypothetical protein AB1689_14540 [Thermodesulfobacteriota bacterium]
MAKASVTALALAVILAAGTARAAVVSTAGLLVEFQNKAGCILVNVGSKPVRVDSIEMIGVFGQVFASAPGFDLGPRRSRVIFVPGREHGSGNDPMFCQAKVAGTAKHVRLTICTDDQIGPCRTVTD